MASDDGAREPSRRELLIGGGAVVAGGAVAWAVSHVPREAVGAPEAREEVSPTLAPSELRTGITWPTVPQRHTIVTVYALADRDAGQLFELAQSLTRIPNTEPDDAQPVTVLVGLGIAHAHALMPDRCARAAGLPVFARDDAGIASGGDLIVQVSAETSAAAKTVTQRVASELGEHGVLWSQAGFRDAPTPAGTTRAGIGFVDGIINPRTAEELRAGVWVGESRRDTFLVARRMLVNDSFMRLATHKQEAAIGRRKADGVPLSGGDTMSEIDLLAKSDDGRPLIPAGAHARRAHPANLGRPLMLRRSYSFTAADGAGLIFLAALADAETFVLTQRRLDELDDLIARTTTTAGDCFFVPEELTSNL